VPLDAKKYVGKMSAELNSILLVLAVVLTMTTNPCIWADDPRLDMASVYGTGGEWALVKTVLAKIVFNR